MSVRRNRILGPAHAQPSRHAEMYDEIYQPAGTLGYAARIQLQPDKLAKALDQLYATSREQFGQREWLCDEIGLSQTHRYNGVPGQNGSQPAHDRFDFGQFRHVQVLAEPICNPHH